MSTRVERAAEKVRKEKEKLAEQERQDKERRAEQMKAIAQAEASAREETRKATNKRRYHVGALADEAGLFAWSNADLAAVFAVLAKLAETPNPAAALEGMVGENGVGFAPTSDDLAPRSSYQRFPSQFPRLEGENSELRPPWLAGI